LVITGPGEPEITVDNIEVAQFIYLMLNNEKVRDVIDTCRGFLSLWVFLLHAGHACGASCGPINES
jgi:hypothetical protein